MENKFNIYTSLLVFAGDSALVDSNECPPIWVLKDEDKQSLDIVREGVSNITGVGSTWFTIDQAGTFEFFSSKHKQIYILYVSYFPSKFDITNLSYKWIKISELKENNDVYNMIRYIYTKGQHV